MSQGVTCIVLAGGLGTRLRGILKDMPKCLAPVRDRSFLEILLDNLSFRGVSRFILSLGYRADLVLATCENLRHRYNIDTVTEGRALGTGGAALFAMHMMDVDSAWVANGDTFLDADLYRMSVPLDRKSGELMRLACIEVNDRTRYGGVESTEGRVTGFAEKGPAGPGLINAGLYHLCRDAFSDAQLGTAFSMEDDVMPKLIKSCSLTSIRLEGTFIDIGVPQDYGLFCERYR